MKLSRSQRARVRFNQSPGANNRAGFIGLLVLSIALNVVADLIRPKPKIEGAKPSGLGDFGFPTATEGRVLSLLWGRCLIESSNVIWYGDFKREAIKKRVKTGMFSSESVTTGYEYFVGIQEALCQGPVDHLTRVYIGDERVISERSSPILHNQAYTIDERQLFGGRKKGSGGIEGDYRFFAGTKTQTASSYIDGLQVQRVGGVTPNYIDVCYVAPKNQRIYIGTAANIKQYKYEVARYPNGLALTGGKEIVDFGANPANVLYEILTSSDWGYGIIAGDINTTIFTAVADVLFTEGNGFSFLLDRPESLQDLIRRVEEQIEGILFQDAVTGQWEIKLIRADYDIMTEPELDSSNITDIRKFANGTYEGTSNNVNVPFFDSDDDWKETAGFSQDMANVRILGTNVTVQKSHPGIKTRGLANDIAWRELRNLSFPLAQCILIVDRSQYALNPGDPFGFTNEDAGFSRFPMRITSVDRGSLLNGDIVIEALQDIFTASAGVFVPPDASLWVPPTGNLVAFPTDQQLAFEAPRALTLRDPDSDSGPNVDKIYAAAREVSQESSFLIVERHDPVTPSGTFDEIGEVFGFMLIGELTTALAINPTVPQPTLLLNSTPDTQADMVADIPTLTDINELGTDLLTVIYIGDTDGTNGEFMLVTSAQVSATEVQLNGLYRGIMDSVQRDHAIDSKVYLIFVGSGISTSTVPAGDLVEVKLIPDAGKDTLVDTAATSIDFLMDNRVRRPYPPSSFDLNGTILDTTNVDLDGSGSGENVGILVDEINRRDFRTVNEINPLTVDAGTAVADFPSANSTEVEVEVRNGATVLTATTGIVGTSTTMRKFDILAGLDEVSLPASLVMAVRQSHTFQAVVYKSRDYLALTFTVADPLVGLHAFGLLDDGVISNSTTSLYVVLGGDDTTDHDFTLSTAFTSGDVEARVNGGSFVQLIAAGATTGNIPNAFLSVSDTIEIRHLSPDSNPQKLITMDVGGTDRAYAILIS